MCPYINIENRMCDKEDGMMCSYFGCMDRLFPGSEHCGLITFKENKLPKLPKKPQSYEYSYYF